ncbi:endonuclease/exonuclease/phosphatase family protein [Streptomyces sp. NRRL F-5135]|uniref:endonuclease/exonuclease/phosphatase family protein n=1 Tax=Streptomyces sp. NRRL F-5135 TaxID=1463858 RepID=UPI0004CBCBC3|nr:endonuclease/exonuclease/phosphatase family protein [Streptomyces sp. NRRL F-5135]
MTRARRRLRYLVAAFGALALTAQLGINSPEAEAGTDLRFWHFNMCGNVCWQPDAPHNYLPGTDSRGEVTVRAAQIVESVGNYSPDIVTLNEACYSQYRGIRAALVAQGYHATYASSGTGGQCDDYDASEGNGFGMALFSKQPIATPRETHNLGTAANPNLLLCADTALGSRPVKACSVHLTAASAEQRAFQATNLAALASGWHATKPEVLMGDFNAEPLDPVMASSTATAVARGSSTRPTSRTRTTPPPGPRGPSGAAAGKSPSAPRRPVPRR